MDPPGKIRHVLRPFEEVFSKRVWKWAKVLLIGAILAPGERTVAAILRVMGLSTDQHFQNYHRVLNRAKWSSRILSRILLMLLISVFVPENAPVVIGIDETIERRRGSKIAATSASIVMRSVRARSFLSKRADCAGSRCCC